MANRHVDIKTWLAARLIGSSMLIIESTLTTTCFHSSRAVFKFSTWIALWLFGVSILKFLNLEKFSIFNFALYLFRLKSRVNQKNNSTGELKLAWLSLDSHQKFHDCSHDCFSKWLTEKYSQAPLHTSHLRSSGCPSYLFTISYLAEQLVLA